MKSSESGTQPRSHPVPWSFLAFVDSFFNWRRLQPYPFLAQTLIITWRAPVSQRRADQWKFCSIAKSYAATVGVFSRFPAASDCSPPKSITACEVRIQTLVGRRSLGAALTNGNFVRSQRAMQRLLGSLAVSRLQGTAALQVSNGHRSLDQKLCSESFFHSSIFASFLPLPLPRRLMLPLSGVGRFKDALNRCIQRGVILCIGLLDRQPFHQSSRKARHDAVIPPKAFVTFFQ